MKTKRNLQLNDIYTKRNEMIERFRAFIDKLDDAYIEGNLTRYTYLHYAREYAKKLARDHVVYGKFSYDNFNRKDIHTNIKSIYTQFPHLLVGNIDKYLCRLTDQSYNEEELVVTAKKRMAIISKNETYEDLLIRIENMVSSFTHSQVVTDKIMFRVMTELN